MPPSAYQDSSSFKLYMSDIGLLAKRQKITIKTLSSPGFKQSLGALTENYAAMT